MSYTGRQSSSAIYVAYVYPWQNTKTGTYWLYVQTTHVHQMTLCALNIMFQNAYRENIRKYNTWVATHKSEAVISFISGFRQQGPKGLIWHMSDLCNKGIYLFMLIHTGGTLDLCDRPHPLYMVVARTSQTCHYWKTAFHVSIKSSWKENLLCGKPTTQVFMHCHLLNTWT